MGVRAQKDPRYQLLKGVGPRRYMDKQTGEVITRGEFERRTATKAMASHVVNVGGPMVGPVVASSSPGTSPGARPASAGTGAGASPAPAGKVPHVVVPPPPPTLSISPGEAMAGITNVANAASEAAAALDQGAAEIANQATPFVALAVAGICQALLPPGFKFMVLEPGDLQTVIAPGGRILARHLPVHVDPLTEDGKDIIALLGGLGLCGAQIWNQFQDQRKADQERKFLEQQYRLARSGDYEAPTAPDVRPAPAGAHEVPAPRLDEDVRAAPANGAADGAQSTGQNGFNPDAAIQGLYAKDAAKRQRFRAL